MSYDERPVRRVVCAAIRATDGEVLVGVRHYDLQMHVTILGLSDGHKFHNRIGPDQGFVDQRGVYMNRVEGFVVQRGVYMNRVEAFDVAVRAGQTKARGPALYSEDLY
jgi:hypothetical protein